MAAHGALIADRTRRGLPGAARARPAGGTHSRRRTSSSACSTSSGPSVPAGDDDARRRPAADRPRHHRRRAAVARPSTTPRMSPWRCSTTDSGDWLAWEGSGDYFDADHGGAIDGVVAPRQPGSALKPFTYAAAFERGLDPGRVLPDVPSQFPTARGGHSLQPAQLRRPIPRSTARARRPGRVGERAGRGARLGGRRVDGGASAAARRLLDARQQRRPTTASASRSATRRCASTNWSQPTPCSPATASASARATCCAVDGTPTPRARDRTRPVGPARHSGSGTSSRTTRRARTSSAAAAVSSFRSRSQPRRAPRSPTTTTGPWATRGTSRSACGSVTSIGTPLARIRQV